jgi:hypothetical protein
MTLLPVLSSGDTFGGSCTLIARALRKAASIISPGWMSITPDVLSYTILFSGLLTAPHERSTAVALQRVRCIRIAARVRQQTFTRFCVGLHPSARARGVRFSRT